MKAKFQKLIGTAVLGLALCSQSLPAWAGLASLPEVTITPDRALGTMAGARYSADGTQYIGCSFSNTNGPAVVCFASDRAGKYAFCTSTNLQGAAAFKSITDFSYIGFGLTPGSAECRFIQIENESTNLR